MVASDAAFAVEETDGIPDLIKAAASGTDRAAAFTTAQEFYNHPFSWDDPAAVLPFISESDDRRRLETNFQSF